MKKILLIFIAAVLVISMAACASDTSSGNGEKQSSVSENSGEKDTSSSDISEQSAAESADNSEQSAAESADNGEKSNAESGEKSAGISSLCGMWVTDTGAGFKFSDDGTGSHFWLDKNDPNSFSSETVFTYEATNDQVTLNYP